jgi:hypothetical protein
VVWNSDAEAFTSSVGLPIAALAEEPEHARGHVEHQRVGHSTGDFMPGSSLQLTGLFQESPDFESKGEFHRPFSILHLFVFELHFL